jgi:hypothetical protein
MARVAINEFGDIPSPGHASFFYDCPFRTGRYDMFNTLNTKRKSGEHITMAFVPDPAVLVNLLLCGVILVLGYLVYRKRNSVSALFIGVAFGMFGLSHLSTLLGQTLFPEVTFVLLRICGYMFVVAALYLSLTE